MKEAWLLGLLSWIVLCWYREEEGKGETERGREGWYILLRVKSALVFCLQFSLRASQVVHVHCRLWFLFETGWYTCAHFFVI
jgi:hypothetical protein